MLKKLKVIGKLILNQNNRSTDQPMFIVQQKVRDWGYASEYSDEYEWINKEEDYESSPDELLSMKLDQLDSCLEETGDWFKCYYKDRFEFVTACFTEQGCKDYLKINGHNLNEPRVYAQGSFRNEEFQTVRNALMELALSLGNILVNGE